MFSITGPSAIKASTQHDTYIPVRTTRSDPTLITIVYAPAGVEVFGARMKLPSTIAAGTYAVVLYSTDEQGYSATKTYTVTQQSTALPVFDPTCYPTLTRRYNIRQFSSLTVNDGRLEMLGIVSRQRSAQSRFTCPHATSVSPRGRTYRATSRAWTCRAPLSVCRSAHPQERNAA